MFYDSTTAYKYASAIGKAVKGLSDITTDPELLEKYRRVFKRLTRSERKAYMDMLRASKRFTTPWSYFPIIKPEYHTGEILDQFIDAQKYRERFMQRSYEKALRDYNDFINNAVTPLDLNELKQNTQQLQALYNDLVNRRKQLEVLQRGEGFVNQFNKEAPDRLKEIEAQLKNLEDMRREYEQQIAHNKAMIRDTRKSEKNFKNSLIDDLRAYRDAKLRSAYLYGGIPVALTAGTIGLDALLD